MPGFWDSFAQAYEPASRQSAAHALKMLATKDERERQDKLLQDQVQRQIATSMINSGVPGQIEMGMKAMKDMGIEADFSPMLQKAQIPEVVQLLKSDAPIGDDVQYDPSVITRATTQAMIEVGQKDQERADEELKRTTDAIGKLPENQRAEAYRQVGIPVPKVENVGLSDNEITRVRNHQKDLLGLPGMSTAADVEQSYSVVMSMRDLLEQISKGKFDPKDKINIAGENMNKGMAQSILIQAFQRMADPGVAVREGDIKLLQGAQSKLDDLVRWVKNWGTGEIVGPDALNAMFRAADFVIKYQRTRIKQAVDSHIAGISGYETNPKLIQAVSDYAKPFYGGSAVAMSEEDLIKESMEFEFEVEPEPSPWRYGMRLPENMPTTPEEHEAARNRYDFLKKQGY